MKKRVLVYSGAWQVFRGFIAICAFFPAIAGMYALKDVVRDQLSLGMETRLWVMLLLPIPIWIVAHFTVATLVEQTMRALGLLRTIIIDDDGVEIRSREKQTRVAWRDVHTVRTGAQHVDIAATAATPRTSREAMGIQLAQVGASFARGRWLLDLVTDAQALTVEGADFRSPLRVEKIFVRALREKLGVELDTLEADSLKRVR